MAKKKKTLCFFPKERFFILLRKGGRRTKRQTKAAKNAAKVIFVNEIHAAVVTLSYPDPFENILAAYYDISQISACYMKFFSARGLD